MKIALAFIVLFLFCKVVTAKQYRYAKNVELWIDTKGGYLILCDGVMYYDIFETKKNQGYARFDTLYKVNDSLYMSRNHQLLKLKGNENWELKQTGKRGTTGFKKASLFEYANWSDLSGNAVEISQYNYADDLELWTCKQSAYLVFQDNVAYYEIWGGKKNSIYFRLDTLIKANDSLYKGAYFQVIKEKDHWLFTDSHSPLSYTRFDKTSSETLQNWIVLINWLNYRDFLTFMKEHAASDREKVQLSSLLEKTRQFSIQDYLREIQKVKSKYLQTDPIAQ